MKSAYKHLNAKDRGIIENCLNQVLNVNLFSNNLIKIFGDVFSYFVSIINLFNDKCQIV